MSQLKLTDRELQEYVLAELRWDPRVEAAHVGVAVDNGVVALTGTASSWDKKQAAQEAAHRVAGVLAVANEIAVEVPGGSTHSDVELAAAARHALDWNVFIPDGQIHITVACGLITLDGEVGYPFERAEAARAVAHLAGVTGVLNRIRVTHAPLAPEAVQRSIEAALDRHAAREASHIHVEVEGSKVTLSGTVHSWADRRAAVGAAIGTRGVDAVVDELEIR